MSNKKNRRNRRRRRQQAKQQSGKNRMPQPAVIPKVESLQNEPEAPAHQNAPNQSRESYKPRIVHNPLYWLEVAFAGVVAVFAIFQFVVGRWQWDAMREQNVVMQRQLDLMAADQRPWLAIETPEDWDFTVGEPLTTVINVRNSGKTPAFIQEAVVVAAVEPAGYDFEKFVRECRNTRAPEEKMMILPPDATNRCPIVNGPIVGPDTLEKIRSGELDFLAMGRMVYLDASKKRHVTERYFKYHADGDSMAGFGTYDRMD